MYLRFYGLREEPFGVTPDPRFLYLSPTYREAQATLEYGIRSGRGFTALVAKPGMGKTTLLFHLLEQYSSLARTAFIFLTQCDSREFMRYLMSELGADTGETDFVRLQDQFGHLLMREAQAGRKVIAVVDEAQNLDANVLETVRLLSDFETPRSKLLHIILTGQPELADKLASPSLLQLRQRISHLVRLEPFSPAEIKQFISHRLRVAGYAGPSLFTPDALSLIVQRSEGIPRNISNLCFNALSLGCALGRKTIDVAILAEVSADLDFEAIAREAHNERALSRDREAAARFHAVNDHTAGQHLPAQPPFRPEPGTAAPGANETLTGGESSPREATPLISPPGPVLVPDPPPAIACQNSVAAEIGNLALQVESAAAPIQPASSAPIISSDAAVPVNGSGAVPSNGSSAPPSSEKPPTVVDVDALASDCALLGMEASRRWKRPVATSPHVASSAPVSPRSNQAKPAAGPGISARSTTSAKIQRMPARTVPVAAKSAAAKLQTSPASAAIMLRKRRSQRSLYLAAAASGLLLLLLVWLLGGSGPSATPSDADGNVSAASPQSSEPATPADNGATAQQPSDSSVLDVIEELPQSGEEGSLHDTRPAVVMRGTRQGEQLVHRVDPVYPAAARLNRIQGAVVLQASIGTHGFLRHIRVLSGDPLLAESVLDAVKGWRYQPRTVRGRPVETPTRVVVNFQLRPRGSSQTQ